MNAWRRSALALAPAGLWLVLGGSAWAAPRTVEAFGPETWKPLRSQIKQPTAVVFTATWCATCPAVMEGLAAQIRQRKLEAPLWVVVIDVAPGEDDAALLRHEHYGRADRLFAFDGREVVLRDRVDPNWRGGVPYVALLAPGAAPRMSLGLPAEAELSAWAAAGRARR